MAEFIASLDVGTSNVRCFIYDQGGIQIYSSNAPVIVLCPEPGGSEIDPETLWSSIMKVVSDAVTWSKNKNIRLKGLGISMQRNTGTFWRADNFKLLSNFITWQDVRSQSIVEEKNNSIRYVCFHSA
mgnify:CR=1 FL=1